MSSRSALSSICRACGQRTISSRSNASRPTITVRTIALSPLALRPTARTLSTTSPAQAQPVDGISLSSTPTPAEPVPTSVPPSATASTGTAEALPPQTQEQQKFFTATITSIHNLTAHASYNKQHWDPKFRRYYTKQEHTLVHDPADLASKRSGQEPTLSAQTSYTVQVGSPITTAAASGEAVTTHYMSLNKEQAGAFFGERGSVIRSICDVSGAEIKSAEQYSQDGKPSTMFRITGNAAATKKVLHSLRTSGIAGINAALQAASTPELYTCELILPGKLRLHLNHGIQHDIASQSGACIFVENAELEAASASRKPQSMRKVTLVGSKRSVETALSLIKVQDKSWTDGETRSISELKEIVLAVNQTTSQESAQLPSKTSPALQRAAAPHRSRPSLLRVGDVVRLSNLTASELALRQTRKAFFDDLELDRKLKSAGKHRKQIVNDHVKSKAKRTRTNRGVRFAVREILTPFGDSLEDRVEKLRQPGTGLAAGVLEGLDATTILGGENLAWWKRREGRAGTSK